jgi:hypothetical protein
MQLNAYLQSPVLQTVTDLTGLVGPKYNFLPELGFEGCINSASLKTLKNQQRVRFHITHNTQRSIYYYQDLPHWKLGYLTDGDIAIAVLRTPQDSDPYPSRFVIQEVQYRKALSYLFSLIVRETISPLEPRGEARSGTLATQLLDTFPSDLTRLEQALDFSLEFVI